MSNLFFIDWFDCCEISRSFLFTPTHPLVVSIKRDSMQTKKIVKSNCEMDLDSYNQNNASKKTATHEKPDQQLI